MMNLLPNQVYKEVLSPTEIQSNMPVDRKVSTSVCVCVFVVMKQWYIIPAPIFKQCKNKRKLKVCCCIL